MEVSSHATGILTAFRNLANSDWAGRLFIQSFCFICLNKRAVSLSSPHMRPSRILSNTNSIGSELRSQNGRFTELYFGFLWP